MSKKRIKIIKITITVLIVGLFVWFLIIYPLIDFKQKENTLEDAGKRYFEINTNKLPTGSRVGTVTIKELYNGNYLDALYQVYSNKKCSLDESFVKVKQVDGEYKYYTYLKCGIMSSLTDHTGPVIKLNGESTITIEKDGEYKEEGVKSVVDDTDGKLDVKDVTIKGTVDTSTIGTYKITYTISDSLANKGKVVRTVKVIETLSATVQRETDDSGYYKGESASNYIEFSNMLYRIINVDSDGTVRISADDSVAKVDYNGIEKWSNDYYYDHINKDSKEYLVNTKYCVDKVDSNSVSTKVDCDKYTTDKKVGILSVTDVNNSLDDIGSSFLRISNMLWLANKDGDDTAWTSRDIYIGEDVNTKYMSFDSTYAMTVKPVLTLKKGIKIVGGDGTKDSPYTIGDTKQGKAGEKLNERNTGEYVSVGNVVYRIIETSDDKKTKVISNETIASEEGMVTISYADSFVDNAAIYKPTQKGNVGYEIENNISKYLVTKYFTKTEIEVPIYKNRAQYGKETSTEKYKVKLSAPDMFEMFSGQSDQLSFTSYWFKNSSKNSDYVYMMSNLGEVYYTSQSPNSKNGIRVVGYFDKDCSIVSGTGTLDNPYKITK